MKHLHVMSVFVMLIGALAVAVPAGAQTDLVVFSTGQYYENGVMLWRSDTGHIWVIERGGRVLNFPASAYGNLPDTPIGGEPARGIRPVLGFGKVWNNFPQVRDLIGWPSFPEVGFYMRIRSEGGRTYLTQSNGIVYQINPDDTWVYAEDPPTPGSYIVSFASDVNEATTNERVTVRWAVHGVDAAQLEIVNPATSQVIGRVSYLPLTGSRTFTIPQGLAAETVDLTLWAIRVTITDVGGVYERVEDATIALDITEPTAFENSPGTTFQSFEHGFMVWRADTQDIYVFVEADMLDASGGRFSVYPHNVYSTLPPNPYSGTPVGRVRPQQGFGQVWGSVAAVRDALGWATAPEQGHLATARAENRIPVSITIPGGATVGLNAAAGTWRWLDGAD